MLLDVPLSRREFTFHAMWLLLFLLRLTLAQVPCLQPALSLTHMTNPATPATGLLCPVASAPESGPLLRELDPHFTAWLWAPF